MEIEENSKFSSPISVISRLDRLDRLVKYLEEKQGEISTRESITMNLLVNKCKPLSTVLDEVHSKGTLMERISMLENSVFQLCLDIEEGNTSISSSSSSTIAPSENGENSFEEPLVRKKPQNYKKSRRIFSPMSNLRCPAKWLGCFQNSHI